MEEYNGDDYIEHPDVDNGEHQASARESPNDISKANQTRRCSSRHKPTGRLSEYMKSLPSISCNDEIMHEEDQNLCSKNVIHVFIIEAMWEWASI